MAAVGGDVGVGGGGGGGWLAQAEPDIRLRVVETIMKKLTRLDSGHQEQFLRAVASFEDRVFKKTSSMSMGAYMREISIKMADLEHLPSAVALQQRMNMRQETGRRYPVQAVQGGNSLVPAMRQETSSIAAPTRLHSQLQGRNNVQQEQPASVPMVDQTVNNQPGVISNQPGQRVVQSVQTQCQAQSLGGQTQFAGCNPASMTMLQGQAAVGPNSQQNHLLRQDASSACRSIQTAAVPFQTQQQPVPVWMNHQGLGANQDSMYMQRHQMYGAQQMNVAGMQIGHQGGEKNQQIKMLSPDQRITLPPQQSAVDQKSSFPCLSSEASTTTASVGLVDWKEDMFQKIRTLKDAYFSKLTELDSSVADHKMTEEQLQSLPKEQSNQYRLTAKLKDATRSALNFLRLEKSSLHEHERTKEQLCNYQNSIRNLLIIHRKSKATITKMNANGQPQNFHLVPRTPSPNGEAAPCSGGGSRVRKNQQEQPAEASTSESTEGEGADDRAPSVSQESRTSDILAAGQAEVEARRRAEMALAMKTMDDNLIDASWELSPAAAAMLGLADNSTRLKRTLDVTATENPNQPGPRSSPKRQKTEISEIEAINSKLIDTEISVVTGDGEDGGTLIEFRHTAVSLAPDMKLLVTTSSGTSLVRPVKLFVPADYPRSSPVVLSHGEGDGQQQLGMFSEISGMADVSFQVALRELPAPISIEEMAMAWDTSVRSAMIELSHRYGGGTFSCSYGRWEGVAPAT